MHRYTKATMPDRRVLLSSLWAFAMFNYLYADVMGLMDASLLRQYLTGTVNGLAITTPFLLAGAVLMEVPIAMTVLARVLPPGPNRWANVGAGVLKTIVVPLTLFVGKPTGYYVFFATIETLCTALIVLVAWRWVEVPPGAGSNARARLSGTRSPEPG